MSAGTYILQAFYDRRGDFRPTFSIANLPEGGDIGGGNIDLVDASKHLGDANYQPIFLPVTVGTPDSTGNLAIPPSGYITDGVPVTVGARFALERPYFYPDGADQPAPANAAPDAAVVTMTQDQHVLAPPAMPSLPSGNALQASFATIRLEAGVAPAELDAAMRAGPYHFPLAPPPMGGIAVWSSGTAIPEGVAPALWPQGVFSKLVDDPMRTLDPQAVTSQGDDQKPIVLIQAITLFEDSIAFTVLTPPPTEPTVSSLVDHVTVMIRPTVLCVDPRHVDRGGLLVTPYLTSKSADPTEMGDKPLFDAATVKAANPLVRDIRVGCLPLGRYAMHLLYPSGQAWTTPNEAGTCAPIEGSTVDNGNGPQCSARPRAVLPSQGRRAVLEIVPPTTDAGKAFCATQAPVPDECLKNP
jgi:hypothetical protein